MQRMLHVLRISPEVNDSGQPLHSLLASRFGLPFIACYVASYMLVTMGIFNVILAVYVDITMKASSGWLVICSLQHVWTLHSQYDEIRKSDYIV